MFRTSFQSAALLAVACFAAACGAAADSASTASTPPEVAAPSVEDTDDHDRGEGAIVSPASDEIEPSFDLITTSVYEDGDVFVFSSKVVGGAGDEVPDPVGALDGAPVWSYVWPTSLDSAVVGFGPEQGILALAATAHPDFDDTPLYDEDGDGDVANDGADWHAHWVVLTEDDACGGGLAVKDIPEGETPTLPATWPELPILIDSPALDTTVADDAVEIRVPFADIGTPAGFSFDGVTSGLRVSTSPHDPLLCVDAVFDIASGDLSLPGTVAE